MEHHDELKRYQEFKKTLNHQIYPVQFSKDINLKLERIDHLLALMDYPQDSYPVIHVGGTSGKGSTASMISSILTAAGFKTGLHTSPHLQLINEGYQIDNHITPTIKLQKLLKELQPAIEKVAKENPFGSPSYFEVQVALALSLFKQEKVDIAVVEVGLGGKLDATNVIDAKIAVITNIGLDHTDILGDTLELIAKDKSGIIKAGQIVISGLTQPSTQEIIAKRGSDLDATVWQYNREFKYNYDKGEETFSVSLPGREYEDLHTNLLGDFQVKNAVCALAAVHAFDSSIPEDCILNGLNNIQIPGRMEIIQKNPTVLLDGAHNEDKIKAAASAVTELFPEKRKVVILAIKKGKKYQDIIPYLIKDASTLITTSFTTELWNPYRPEVLANYAKSIDPDLAIIIEPDPMKALNTAFRNAYPGDLIWVTGSLYLVGNIRNYWYSPIVLLSSFEENF